MRDRTLFTRAIRSLVATAVVAAGLAIAGASNPATASVGGFDDVPAGTWYSDAVAWLADSGITTGTSDTTFSPDDPVTRAQMAAFIARFLQSEGEPGAHGFADVASGSFYDGAVTVLAEREITTGTSPTTYSPDDLVSRAQMAAFLHRVAGEPPSDFANPFIDNPPGTYYYDAVRWMVETGVTTGTSPITYSPGATVSRKQMATFLWRLAGEPTVGTPGENRIDEDETVVAEEGDIGGGSTIDPDGDSEIEWVGDDQPEEGQFVVLGVTDETPEGFIGEVTETDGDMVMTEPARLQDVIDEAELYHVVEQEEAELAVQGLADELSENLECSGGGTLEVEFEFDLDAGMVFEASWSLADGTEAFIGFDAALTTSVTPSASGEVECRTTYTAASKTLKAITFAVGPVPVVLVPEISLVLGVTGEVSAAMTLTTLTYEQDVEAGIQLEDGRWRTVFDTESTLSSTPPSVDEVEVSLGFDVRARLDLKAYGIGGPFVTFGPFIELNVQNEKPWFYIDGGLVASIGAELDVAFFKEEVEFPDWEILRERLWDTGNDLPPGGFDFLKGINLRSADSHGANSCGVGPFGNVFCWGDNTSGQLGDGSDIDADEARMVRQINSATEVNTGGDHACAIHDGGQVSCWGSNQFDQLGDGTGDSSDRPVDVVGLDDAVRIEMGTAESCAIRTDWTAWCWGRMHGPTPVEIPELYPAHDLAIGNGHICGARAYGDVYCWGDGYYGQLGNGEDGPFAGRDEPTAVPMFFNQALRLGVEEIDSHGLHTCARIHAGDVYCWGAGREGQLGNNDFRDSSVPVKVQGLSGRPVSITTGDRNSCAVTRRTVGDDESSQAYCWGGEPNGQNGDGQDGHGNNFEDWTAVGVLQSGGAETVSAGLAHSCATFGRRVVCWGSNGFGQLGDPANGSQVNEPTNPVQAE